MHAAQAQCYDLGILVLPQVAPAWVLLAFPWQVGPQKVAIRHFEQRPAALRAHTMHSPCTWREALLVCRELSKLKRLRSYAGMSPMGARRETAHYSPLPGENSCESEF